MDEDCWRWTPEVEPLIPTVDCPDDPPEIGRLYGPDGELLFILVAARAPFGFTSQ